MGLFPLVLLKAEIFFWVLTRRTKLHIAFSLLIQLHSHRDVRTWDPHYALVSV